MFPSRRPQRRPCSACSSYRRWPVFVDEISIAPRISSCEELADVKCRKKHPILHILVYRRVYDI